MDYKKVIPVVALSATVIAGTAFALNANQTDAQQNLFEMSEVTSTGVQVANHHDGDHKCGAGSCGGDKAKDGDHKCGAGSCGGDHKDGDHGDDHKDEHKDGDHKCGAGSCG